jgi:ubiquinone/menaquinone biosynthesis C-methylase UbiE
VTNRDPFDQYAESYHRTVDAAIGASGESVEYFARLKAELAWSVIAPARPRRILDFGCGSGLSTRALRGAVDAQVELTGVDPSTASIAIAKSRAPDRTTFVPGARDRLPFEDATFDAAFTACVFHHIPAEEHEHWGRELRRVLRPGGIFINFEHNPYNPLTRRVVRDCPFDKGVTLLRPSYARRMIERAGFSASRTQFYFFFPAFVSVLRPLERWLRWLPVGAQYYVVATATTP